MQPIFITGYKNANNVGVEIWFNPLTEQLINKSKNSFFVMGKPQNFIYPNVPLPQDMRTPQARKITLFCAEWLAQKEGKGANNSELQEIVSMAKTM